MRIPLILLATAAIACGSAPHGTGSPPIAPPRDFAAARWIPAHPTYAFAARHVRDAQHAAVGLVDSLGVLAGVRPRDVVEDSRALFGVDITSEDALASIGIDTDAGFAVFSDDIDPTLVGKLAQPALFAEYVGRERTRGMVTSSVIADGVEVFAARIIGPLQIQWAIADGWLWVHVATGAEKRDVLQRFDRAGAPALGADDVAWLARSRRGGAELPWGRVGRAALAAFVDMPAVVKSARGAFACAQLVAPIRGISVAGDADATRLSARIAIDLGDDARSLASHVLAPPPGWASIANGAPLAAAWNLDVDALVAWLTPCGDLLRGHALRALRTLHVRAARAVVLDYSGRLPMPHGIVSADLSDSQAIGALLDDVPMRARFESDRTFGPYAGHRVSVPLVVSFDYVLTDRVLLASNADGLLDRAVAPVAPTPPVLASVMLLPPKLSIERWRGLLELANISPAEQIADHLARWAKLAFAARIDGSELVVELAAERR